MTDEDYSYMDEPEPCDDDEAYVSHACDCSFHRCTRNLMEHYRECADCAERVGFTERGK